MNTNLGSNACEESQEGSEWTNKILVVSPVSLGIFTSYFAAHSSSSPRFGFVGVVILLSVVLVVARFICLKVMQRMERLMDSMRLS